MAHIFSPKFWIIGLVLLALLLAQSHSHAQQSDSTRYFPETGHWVTDAFLQKYNEAANPELLYGYPITDAFDPPIVPGSPALRVQYFERARFEYQTDFPDLGVTLSNIGIFLHANLPPGETITAQPGLAACQYFSQTQHQVCYAFLDFFNAHGGFEQFGYPLSEVVIQDGRMMQYFQRARFEWHPERPSGQRVVLSDVGKMYFDMVEDPFLQIENGAPNVIVAIQVRAFVQSAVIGGGENQTIYVIVQDQNHQPIANADVTFALDLPEGEMRWLMPPTDANGITRLTFPAAGEIAGVIPITVKVDYSNGADSYQKQTTTSYRVWW
jgi:hypothetical protein